MTSFFPQKMVPESKPEWNREAITVFSRLPSLRRLQATHLLQTSLFLIPYTYALEMLSFEMNSEYEFFQIELPNFILEKNMNSDIFRTHELIPNLRDTGF